MITVPIAQRIEPQPSKLEMQVRFLLGTTVWATVWATSINVWGLMGFNKDLRIMKFPRNAPSKNVVFPSMSSVKRMAIFGCEREAEGQAFLFKLPSMSEIFNLPFGLCLGSRSLILRVWLHIEVENGLLAVAGNHFESLCNVPRAVAAYVRTVFGPHIGLPLLVIINLVNNITITRWIRLILMPHYSIAPGHSCLLYLRRTIFAQTQSRHHIRGRHIKSQIQARPALSKICYIPEQMQCPLLATAFSTRFAYRFSS